ncbi:short chain dehydrogenase [Stemphylium lycopersici]|nr:short chain dehydrogenase [Stemphylium lycopersici]
MPRHSWTREESNAQVPPRAEAQIDDARSHKRHHRSHRSRSPRRGEDGHRHKRRRSRSPAPKPVDLPYKAKPLSKRQYEEYRPLFQSYLDIQKSIQLDDLDEREGKGRWKSFEDAQTESDDDFGPAPPTDLARHSGHGPTIPKLDDLTYRNELRDEDRARGQSDYVDDIRYARKTDRKAQKERLEELAPRADPGSRERQLEKKRETTSTLQSFRDAKESGEADVAESDLMGDDGIDNYKKKKKEQERQKNEREIRREEIARAREAERNERLAERREKEGKTMDFLRQIAQERFG